MVGRCISFWGPAYVQRRLLLVSGSVIIVANDTIEKWDDPPLGCPRKLGSKVRISGLKAQGILDL